MLTLVPSFMPSFKIVNGKRIYDLMPDKITLVKWNGTIPEDSTVTPGGSDTTDPGTDPGSGSDTTDPGSGSGSDTGREDYYEYSFFYLTRPLLLGEAPPLS